MSRKPEKVTGISKSAVKLSLRIRRAAIALNELFDSMKSIDLDDRQKLAMTEAFECVEELREEGILPLEKKKPTYLRSAR